MRLRSTHAWVLVLAGGLHACVLSDFGVAPGSSADDSLSPDIVGAVDAPDAAPAAGSDVPADIPPPEVDAGAEVPAEDLDLDGLLDDVDPCPAVWSPDGDGSVCGLDGATRPQAWQIALSPVAQRRVRQWVEVPLVAGWLDGRVAGLWRLDGTSTSEAEVEALEEVGVTYGDGVYGDPLGAAWLDGSGFVRTPAVWSGAPPYALFVWVSLAPDGGGGTVFSTDGDHAITLSVTDGQAVVSLAGSVLAGAPAAGWTEGWHHLALLAWARGGPLPDGRALLIDGEVVAADDEVSAWGAGLEEMGIGADVSSGEPTDHWKGGIDELVVFGHMLGVDDVAAYVRARRPLGTSLVSGSRADFDDVAVVLPGADGAPAQRVPAELVGPRPYSTSACPDGADPAGFAQRDDLCSVLGHWSLASLGDQAVSGRFGDPGGAVEPSDEAVELGLVTTTSSATWEAWVRPEPCPQAGDEAVLLRHGDGEAAADLLRLEAACAFGVPALGQPPVDHAPWERTDQWLHVAVVSDAEAGVTTLWVDGAREQTLTGAIPPGAGVVSLPQQVFSRVDELIVHDVAKSPSYIRRRGERAVPVLRFLATTEAAPTDGAFAWLGYELRWGATAAAHRAPLLHDAAGVAHAGLLSAATGVAAWWRARTQLPVLLPDHGPLGADATLEGVLPGPTGGATFPASATTTTASVGAWEAGSEGTLEVVWRHGGTGALADLISQGPAGTPCWTLQAAPGQATLLWSSGADHVSVDGAPSATTGSVAADLTTAELRLSADGGATSTAALGEQLAGDGAVRLMDGVVGELRHVRLVEGRVLAPAERLQTAAPSLSLVP